MKKILWLVIVLVVVSFVSPHPVFAELKDRKNPVHERRKAAQEKKQKKTYKAVNEDAKKAKQLQEAADKEKEKAEKLRKKAEEAAQPLPVKPVEQPRLVQEFDLDKDGVISYEEMNAAITAGKGDALKAEIKADKEKNKVKAEDAKEGAMSSTSNSADAKKVKKTRSKPKEIIIKPDGK